MKREPVWPWMRAAIGLDRLGIVSDWNAEAERMFGYGVAKANGYELVELIVPREERAAKREELSQLLAGTIKNVEIAALRADGSILEVGLAVAEATDCDDPDLFHA